MARSPRSLAPFPNPTIGLDIVEAAIFTPDATDVYVTVAEYPSGSIQALLMTDPHADLWAITVGGEDQNPTAITGDGNPQIHLTMPGPINAGDIIQAIMGERLGITVIIGGDLYEGVIQHASTLVVALF